MTINVAEPVELVTPGDLGDELASFARHARKQRQSELHTGLRWRIRQFGRWLLAHDYPTNVREIDPRHIEEWIGSLLKTNRPSTAHNRWRGLQRFMN